MNSILCEFSLSSISNSILILCKGLSRYYSWRNREESRDETGEFCGNTFGIRARSTADGRADAFAD